MRPFSELLGASPQGFDPEHRFVTSWLLPPLGLAIYRALFALFAWATRITYFAWYGINDPSGVGESFSLFTDLTWWGITFYMTISSIHTFVYWKKGRSWLNTWPTWLGILHGSFYTTIVTLPFLVTIVYWAVLYDSWFTVTFQAFSNIARHALNSLVALLEIILPATNPPPWLHMVIVWIVLLLYLALAYLTYATQGWYTYGFLNPKNGGSGKVAVYCVGIAVGGLVIFVLAKYSIWLRCKLAKKQKLSAADTQVARINSDVEMVHAK